MIFSLEMLYGHHRGFMLWMKLLFLDVHASMSFLSYLKHGERLLLASMQLLLSLLIFFSIGLVMEYG